jgi:hypothetical protein
VIARLAWHQLKRSSGWQIILMATVVVVAWPRVGIISILPLIVAMIWRSGGARVTAFEAALPISGRALYLSHVLASLGLVWLPVGAWIAASLVRGQKDWPLYSMFDALAVGTLFVLVLHMVRPRSLGWPPAAIMIPVALAVAAGCAATIYLLSPTVAPGMLVAADVAAFLFTLRQIPAAFESAPRVHKPERAMRSRAQHSAAPQSANALWFLLRTTIAPSYLMYFGLMVMCGMIGKWLLYLFIFTSTATYIGKQRTGWMRALPLSHRQLLAITIIPPFLSILGGLAVGQVVTLPWPRHFEMLGTNAPSTSTPNHYFESRSNVSIDYWQHAPSGPPTKITAPWGESAVPDTITILGRLLYNPYTTQEQNSERFVEWQFGRATTAVYGRPMTLAEYDDASRPRPARLTHTPRMFVLNAGATVVAFLLFVCLGEIALRTTPRRTPRLQHAAILVSCVPMFMILGLDVFYDRRRHLTEAVMPFAESFILRLSAALPSNPIIVVLVAALPVLFAYALLQWQFARTESIGRPAAPRAG